MTQGNRCLTISLGMAVAGGLWIVAGGLMMWGIVVDGQGDARWIALFVLTLAAVETIAALLSDNRVKTVEAMGLQLMMANEARQTTRLTPAGRD